MDLQLRDIVAMIVGATGGIGHAVAESFAQEGASLALVGRDATKLARLEEDLAGYAVTMASFTGDLDDPASAETCVRDVEARFGRVDLLAMCAGNAKRGGLDAVTDADFASTWQVKLMGPVRLARGGAER